MNRYSLTNPLSIVFLLILSILVFSGCANKKNSSLSEGDQNDTLSAIANTKASATNKGATVTITDMQARKFVEAFDYKNTFPIIVNEELFDSSRVISDDDVKKFIKGNSTKYYYGTRFLLRDSIYGLVYHYLYKFVPEQSWVTGLEYVASSILYLDANGKEIDKINKAYYNEKGFNERGEDYIRNNQASLMKDGVLVHSKAERTEALKDGELLSYEEVKSTTYYSWNNTNRLVKGETTIDVHTSEIVNPKARQAVLDTLNEIKDLTFIGVVKQNDTFYRINPKCPAASKYHIIYTPEELKTSTFSTIHQRYLPVWVDENNEYSAALIAVPDHDKLSGEYSFFAKSFETFRDDYPVISLHQNGNEINFVHTGDGYWMVKVKSGDDMFFMEEKYALTLPVSDYSCEPE